ncbi:DUF1007 domain-containing protein [Roseovarius sp. TE539]|nr:DUF1007 domain-containing protein [Roseovarius sp. TE539]
MIHRVLSTLCLVGLLVAPHRAPGHPHVFVDAGLTLIFDERGQLAALRVFWAYDAFYSLMMIEERGLDPDGDGTLTDAELDSIAGTDVDWEAGFPGDLHLSRDGDKVALSRPVRHGADYEPTSARIVTRHVRPLTNRIDPAKGAVAIRVYDPGYFVKYDVTLPVTVEGREDCRLTRRSANPDRAARILEREIAKLPADVMLENEYPEVGRHFADTLIVSCGATG